MYISTIWKNAIVKLPECQIPITQLVDERTRNFNIFLASILENIKKKNNTISTFFTSVGITVWSVLWGNRHAPLSIMMWYTDIKYNKIEKSKPFLKAFNFHTNEQTDVARSTWLVILFKNIYTSYGRKYFVLPDTYSLRV